MRLVLWSRSLKREAVERGEERKREGVELRKKEVGSEPTFGHTNNVE